MEIAGFKSFRQRVRIQFPEGITGFVGPNGCGKSNLLDAMCWALGEQSAVALRGQKMQDLIFAGTPHRKPAPMAEVSIRLVGSNGSGEERLDLTRRLFQSGDSEYVLNGRKVRLRDITERLMGTGIGVRAYSTIHQGKIEEILSSRPEDRRLLIEEAAGITRYRSRRRSASLKMEHTEQDLLRVEDILREVGRQRNSLKRQASAARRFRHLKEEERALLRLEFGLRQLEMAALFQEAERARAQAREVETEATRRTAEAEARLEALRLQLEESEGTLGRLRDEQHRREREIDLLEHRISICGERGKEVEADLESRRGEAAQMEESLRSGEEELRSLREAHEAEEDRLGEAHREVAAAEEEFDRERKRLEELEGEAERAREAVFEATASVSDHQNAAKAAAEAAGRTRSVADRFRSEATSCLREQEKASDALASAQLALAAAREAHRSAQQARASCRERLAAVEGDLAAAREAREKALTEESRQESRLALLKQLDEEGGRCTGGVRALLEAARRAELPGFRGMVADHLEVEPGAEDAVEAVLRQRLQWMVVEGAEAAAAGADRVRDGEAGGAGFLYGPLGGETPSTPEAPEGTRPLAGMVRSEDPLVAAALGVWLGSAFLAPEPGRAAELAGAQQDRIFVTPEGACWGPGPVLLQRGGAEEGSVLRLRRQLREAAEALGGARHARAAEDARCGRLEIERAQLREEGAECEREEHRAERTVFEEEHQVAAITQNRERLRIQHDMLLGEAERADGEALEHDGAHEQALASVFRTEERRDAQSRRLAEVREQIGAAANHLGALEQELRRLREILADRREKRESARLRLEHAEHHEHETLEALERLGQETALLERRRDTLLEEVKQAEASLEKILVEREEAKAGLREAEEAATGIRTELQEIGGTVKGFREEQERAAQVRGEREVHLAGLRSDREHLHRECRIEMGVEVEQVLAAPPRPAREGEEAGGSWEDPDLPSLEKIAEDLGEVRTKLARIGTVNLVAIEEYEELDKRYTFLKTQDEDIRAAVESLRKTIREIDRISRERFAETFEAVRKNFIETFLILFKGGEADIRLQDAEDPLNCGVEIYARPPGKRLQNIRLLSGGEKALSAIAFLFGLFRYKPSPFCVLDEVDAPLDDVNLARFLELLEALREETQFILITHNKLSMERANVLYGVTMEEPGCSKLVSVDFRANGKSNGRGNGKGNGGAPSADETLAEGSGH